MTDEQLLQVADGHYSVGHALDTTKNNLQVHTHEMLQSQSAHLQNLVIWPLTEFTGLTTRSPQGHMATNTCKVSLSPWHGVLSHFLLKWSLTKWQGPTSIHHTASSVHAAPYCLPAKQTPFVRFTLRPSTIMCARRIDMSPMACFLVGASYKPVLC